MKYLNILWHKSAPFIWPWATSKQKKLSKLLLWHKSIYLLSFKTFLYERLDVSSFYRRSLEYNNYIDLLEIFPIRDEWDDCVLTEFLKLATMRQLHSVADNVWRTVSMFHSKKTGNHDLFLHFCGVRVGVLLFFCFVFPLFFTCLIWITGPLT